MKVYLVMTNEPDSVIYGIFSTEDRAHKAAVNLGVLYPKDRVYVAETELDTNDLYTSLYT